MIDVRIAADPALSAILDCHPHVRTLATASQSAAVEWEGRTIYSARADVPLRGILELIDNNPLVCADRFSLPDAATTLALIAFGPLIASGIVQEVPSLLMNQATDESLLTAFLEPLGWNQGCDVHPEPIDLDGVAACTLMAVVANPDRLEDLDDLFGERYDRSLYVRRVEDGPWDVSLVKGRAHATYRLRLSPGEGQSLLTVQVMADLHGKCGAAQIVHAFNVMNGFEESLSIEALD